MMATTVYETEISAGAGKGEKWASELQLILPLSLIGWNLAYLKCNDAKLFFWLAKVIAGYIKGLCVAMYGLVGLCESLYVYLFNLSADSYEMMSAVNCSQEIQYSSVKTCFHISKCPWTWGAGNDKTETTQTHTKMLTLGLNIISKAYCLRLRLAFL